jgi:hypothetical protein
MAVPGGLKRGSLILNPVLFIFEKMDESSWASAILAPVKMFRSQVAP